MEQEFNNDIKIFFFLSFFYGPRIFHLVKVAQIITSVPTMCRVGGNEVSPGTFDWTSLVGAGSTPGLSHELLTLSLLKGCSKLSFESQVLTLASWGAPVQMRLLPSQPTCQTCSEPGRTIRLLFLKQSTHDIKYYYGDWQLRYDVLSSYRLQS